MSEVYTREQMVEELAAPEVVETPADPVAKTEDDKDSAATLADDISEAEEPGDDVDGVGDDSTEEEQAEAEADPVDPPQWWDAEDKEVFKSLTPEQQAAVAKNEAKREAIIAKSKQEAADERKTAETKTKELVSLAEKISQAITKAEQAFKSRWDGMTEDVWAQLADADPTTYAQLHVEFTKEQADLKRVRDAEEEASRVAQEEHFKTQGAKLLEIAPDLVKDPKTLRAVGEYGVKQGIDPKSFAQADAVELAILHKAMLYDKLQAKLTKPAQPTTETAKAPSKAVAPTARVTTLPPQQREIQRLKNRFDQTGNRDDLVALLAAQG